MTERASAPDDRPAAASRDALLDLATDYVAAVVANDPDAVPIAPTVGFVENLVQKDPGEGLWQTASAGPTSFEITVPDPAAGQVGYLGRIEEDGDSVLLGLRLAVRDGAIAEAEHLIARDLTPGRDGHTNLDNLQTPRPAFREPVPPDERDTRDELLDIADAYYDAVAEDDGSLAPFAEGCVRIENGFQTTCETPPPDPEPAEILRTLDAAEQLDAGAFANIKRIEPRRVDVADVETGLVCGRSQLRHPMEETTLDIAGLSDVETVERDFDPFDTVALHAFKITGGLIQAIEAVGFTAPYDSPTGWE